MVPSGRIPQAKPGRSRILYRKPGPRQGDRVEQKPKKKKRGLVRSLTLRPSVSSTAGSMPQGLPFPLGFISHSLWRKESKGKKVRSYSVAHAPAGEYISTAVHVNSESLAALSGMTAVALPWVSHRVPPTNLFPFGCLGLCHGR